MNCPECRKDFKPRRVDQKFCSSPCNTASETRAMKRARVLYRALYWWRYDRKRSARDALRFICREIRDWIEEDADAGRPPPPRYSAGTPQGHEKKPARKSRGEHLTAYQEGRMEASRKFAEDLLLGVTLSS